MHACIYNNCIIIYLVSSHLISVIMYGQPVIINLFWKKQSLILPDQPVGILWLVECVLYCCCRTENLNFSSFTTNKGQTSWYMLAKL